MKRSRQQHTPPGDQSADNLNASDLLAGMVFIFLIILAVFTIRFDWDKKELERTKSELSTPAITRLRILQDIREQLANYGVHTEIFANKGVLSFNDESIPFPQSEASPSPDRMSNIAALATVLASILPCYAHHQEPPPTRAVPGWCQLPISVVPYRCASAGESLGKIETIMIEGHTDPTPVKATASYPDNLTLSAMRASTVWNRLEECQPSLASLYNKSSHNLFAVSGYAFQRPAYPDPMDPRNRRIDIRVVMELPDSALAATAARQSVSATPSTEW